MTDRDLGVSDERSRIMAIIWSESVIWKLAGELRIAHILDTLATKVQLDHREDNER